MYNFCFIFKFLTASTSICLNERKHTHFTGYSMTFFLALCIRLRVTMGTSKHNRANHKTRYWNMWAMEALCPLVSCCSPLEKNLVGVLWRLGLAGCFSIVPVSWECSEAAGNLLKCCVKRTRHPWLQRQSMTEHPGCKKPMQKSKLQPPRHPKSAQNGSSQ